MKKTFYLIALGLFVAIAGPAQTIALTNTSSSVSHQWNSPYWPDTYGSSILSPTKLASSSPPLFIDSTSLFGSEGSGFNINATNFTTVANFSYTWNAPPGMMFVVTPPSSALGPLNLQFAASFATTFTINGIFGSLGNVSFNLVYGAAPTNNSSGISEYYPNNGIGQTEGLDLTVQETIPANGGSFAFTSVTVTGEIILNSLSYGLYSFNSSPWEPYAIILFGGNSGATDPGPLLTLQPYSATPPTPPALGISTYSNQPAVFYPTASGTNFVLQMTTNLASGNWVTVTNGVPFSCVVITNPPGNAFFRLQ